MKISYILPQSCAIIGQMGFLIFQMEHVSLLEYKIQQPRKSNMELYKGVKEKDKLIKIE